MSVIGVVFAASICLSQTGVDRGQDGGRWTDSLSIMGFTGYSVRGFQSFPFELTHGDQFQLGLAAAYVPIDLPFDIRAGLDGGAALRFDGDRFSAGGSSMEIWLGPTLRHEGLEIGQLVIKPSLSVGLSLATRSYGLERAREIEEDGDAVLVYSYGPEIGIALRRWPNIDLVYRLNHRSGASQVPELPTLGGIGDTANVNLFGVRYHF